MATNNNKKPSTKKRASGSKNVSNYKYQKKAVKAVSKAAKKNPKAFIIISVVAVVAIGIGLAVYFLVIKNKNNQNTSSSEPTSSEVVGVESSIEESSSEEHEHSSESHSHEVVADGISINFLELGNWYTGDSTFIKAGDIDILIDAGSRKNSTNTIKSFINEHCTDGKLEYVIATHAHQDHIAGFVGSSTMTGIFESYEIDTLIDFALTDVTSTLYSDYVSKRDTAITNGTIKHHYTAAQCINETDGATKQYVINESTTMTILDQRFYRESSSDENNYSVCTLFTHGSNHYLFTGDLEKDGEASLVALNDLPHCQLFKGGHHGSKTSNTDALLSKITPEVVCICCCCGNDEYTDVDDNQFPTQIAINNIAKYTDKIFVTTISTDNSTKAYTSLNGNITFKCDDGVTYTVTGSNNSVILKETDWFKTHRTWPTDGV